MKKPETCEERGLPHRFRLGEQDGPTSRGVCHWCGATREMKNVYVLDRPGEAQLKTNDGTNRRMSSEPTGRHDAGTIKRHRKRD